MNENTRDGRSLRGSLRFGIRRRAREWFHAAVNRLVSSNIPSGSVVFDVGCGDGSLLRMCDLSLGVGIDHEPSAKVMMNHSWRNVRVLEADLLSWSPAAGLPRPDVIVAAFVLDQVDDIYLALRQFRTWSVPETRLITVSYNRFWTPVLWLAELLGFKSKVRNENYIPWREVDNLLRQSGYEVVKHADGILVPFYIPVLSNFINRFLAPLPVIRAFALVRLSVSRPVELVREDEPSVSVIIPARNEAGNIKPILERLPRFTPRLEVIFVEGNSADHTWEQILACVRDEGLIEGLSVKAFQQSGVGKGDAVRMGFAEAQGDILAILDADISVPPEELPRFVELVATNFCDLANGSRLVYPMERQAMRFLNLVGNWLFGIVFSFLIGQQVRDTLCGTKVLKRDLYQSIANNREQLGTLDPFGDFDLLLGAAKLNQKITDVPVHYCERTYGSTNISRFRHGMLLVNMTFLAALQLKFVRNR